MPSNLKTLLTEDPPIELDATYVFNTADRRYIDDQALAAQQHLVDSLLSGAHCTWFQLSGGSVAVVPGDCVCASGEAPFNGTVSVVTKATSIPLGLAGGVAGV